MADRRDPTLMHYASERWRFCVALAIGAGLLHAIPEFASGETAQGIAMPALLWAIEVPIQVYALSKAYDAALARRISPTAALVACVSLAVAMGTVLAIALVYLFQGVLGFADDYGPPGPMPYPLVALLGATSGIIFAGLWGLAFVSPHTTKQTQRRELEAQQLRFEADQLRTASELARLRSQLEPHFLLNTLNTIAGLVVQRPGEARRLLGCLGDLLRDVLEDESEIQSLDQEVTWLRRYADILESRHGDALRFDWDITPAAAAVLIPRLLLQPLVENAVQHGALNRASGGRVAIAARLDTRNDQATLICTVRDNGPGLSSNGPRFGAVGLRTVRRRLELQCPGAALRLESTNAGTVVTIEVPTSGGSTL